MPPSVSVLMDVGKDGTYLDPALDSLVRQTFTDFEVILVVNGGTEDVSAIVRRWEEREPRLRAFRIERRPLAQAHNFAARHARGPFFARLDADDAALPMRLELQHQALVSEPDLVLVGGAAQVIDATGRTICTLRYEQRDAQIRRALRHSCPFVHSATMIRAEAFWAAGGYREGLNLSEDYELYTRLIKYGRAVNIDEPLVQYRVHNNALSTRIPHRMAITHLSVVAAQEARRRSIDEPFRDGVPWLRQVQRILGLSRPQLRRRLRAASLRLSISRRLFLLPLPVPIKSVLRRVALGIGLRRLYVRLLDALTMAAGKLGHGLLRNRN